jgi:hypothetical protein
MQGFRVWDTRKLGFGHRGGSSGEEGFDLRQKEWAEAQVAVLGSGGLLP